MPTIYGDEYQLFITCDDNGNITSADYGQMIVRMDSADFFFIYQEDEGNEIMANIDKYKIVLNGFRASLVLKKESNDGNSEETEPTPEEPPVEPEPTEPPTGEEEPPMEEPPVEEPVEDPATDEPTDEPTDETPVEEPTNPTE